MSKKINHNELDSILKDIYDTKIPENRQFSFRGETETNINSSKEPQTDEKEYRIYDISSDRRKYIIRHTISAAASLILLAGFGFAVFRNADFEKNENNSDNNIPAASDAAVTEELLCDASNEFSDLTESDNIWDYFNRDYLSYPDGYCLDYSLNSDNEVTYMIMRKPGDDEEKSEVFRFDMKNKTFNSVCNVSDKIYRVSPDGELYGFYRNEDSNIVCENIADRNQTLFSSEYYSTFFHIISGNRVIYIDYRDEAEPYIIFFDENGNMKKEIKCEFIGEDLQNYSSDPVKTEFIKTTQCPDDSTMLNFTVSYGSYIRNGYCRISRDSDEIIQSGILDEQIYSHILSDGAYEQKMSFLYGDEIYGVFENNELSAILHISEFYNDWQNISDFRYTEDGIYIFFADHAEKITDKQ